MRSQFSFVLCALSCILGPEVLIAQLQFSAGSRLGDSVYVRQSVRDISDEGLFTALRSDIPALKDVLLAARQRNFIHAYRVWASYWSSKQQPRYITQDHKFLLDTEMLKSYDEARSYAASHPDERDSILARARLLKQNTIRTWGDSVVHFGPVVDFDRDIGRSGKYGFHYWGWSRPLLSAFIFTADQTYLAKFDELFNRWYDQRNTITRRFVELDVVYYELGLGTRNRAFIEYYLLPYHQRPWQTHERMLKTILGAARWLYELQKWEGYRSGNWQIHGSYMLAQIAMAFPEFRDSQEWLHMALQRLQEHLEQDFFDDGGHSERAPRNYTLATYLSYRNLYYLLSVYGVRPDLASIIRQRMGNTIDWWISMITPTGEIPAINDSHRGLFPAFVLADGADFFRKPYVYGVLKNLLGYSPAGTADSLPSFVSRHMPASGFSIMRSDWTRDALYANINYGSWNGAHTHNDMLDFELYAYGRALAVDAGLGLTYDDPLYTTWYKSSRAHNMVTVNDQDLSREKTKGKNVVWSTGPRLDYFAAEHDGYESQGIHHRRQIAFIKSKYWVVLDELQCRNGGDTLSWYFHTPLAVTRKDLGYQSTTSPGIMVLPALGADASRVGTGTAASTSTLIPGKTEEIHWVAFDQMSSSNSIKRFAVLLFPFRKPNEQVSFFAPADGHFRVVGPGFSDDLYVSDTLTKGAGMETDARFVVLHRESGRALQLNLVEGTYLRWKGKEIWKSDRRAAAEYDLEE
jgi:hypothetical protein